MYWLDRNWLISFLLLAFLFLSFTQPVPELQEKEINNSPWLTRLNIDIGVGTPGIHSPESLGIAFKTSPNYIFRVLAGHNSLFPNL